SSEVALTFAGLLGATHLDSRRRALPASPINGIEHRWVPPAVARRALQVLGINAVFAVHFAADRVGDGQHSLVVFQDPADLRPLCAVLFGPDAADVLDHHESELAGEAAGLELAHHAHQRYPEIDWAHLAQPPQQLDPVE